MTDRLLTTREVAAFLGLSPETVLRRWRSGDLANEVRADRSPREHHRSESPTGLFDLRGGDLRFAMWFDESHPSAGCSAAEEAHNTDDLALRGKLLADVLVERIDCVSRVLRDERHSEGSHPVHKEDYRRSVVTDRFLSHQSTCV